MATIDIGSRTVGRGLPTYLVAEIGANHNGSLETARELVRLSAQTGVDAVKFQAYSRETLYAPELPDDGSPEAKRNIELLKRRWDILPRCTAPDGWWPELKSLCDGLGVEFLCTPFDLDRLRILDGVGVKAHKIASGDITWHELLRAAAATRKPVILSTGASTFAEVERAVGVLTESGCRELVLLHCVSNYPPKWEDANLRAIETLSDAFGVPVGLSDHSPGSVLPVAAVSLGACMIEKHVTLDRTQEGLDHHFALEVDELARMVEDVRHVEVARGTPEKTWVTDEQCERYWVRRGIWADCELEAGDRLSRENIAVVRPKEGIGAEGMESVIGRRLCERVPKGAPLQAEELQ